MKRVVVLFVLAIVLALSAVSAACAAEVIRSLMGQVTRVSDGDTLQITSSGTKVKVRMYGIDAPERKQAYGREAFEALRSKVSSKTVRVDILTTDRYKRVVAVVWLEGRNLNREMVAEGHAWAYRRYLDRPYASEFIDAEEAARRARLGLWQQYNPQPPWEFRSVKRRSRE